MQTVAIIASWVAFGACLAMTVVHGVVLRFELDWYGRHVMVWTLAVSALVGLIIVLVADKETSGTFASVAVLMCVVVALSVWRIVMILRHPDQGT